MTRFHIEKKGTVYNNIVDMKQPKLNGPGIIASSHSDEWAKTICDALNHCDSEATTSVQFPSIPTLIKEAVTDHDT